jgi:hypothetical protein
LAIEGVKGLHLLAGVRKIKPAVAKHAIDI